MAIIVDEQVDLFALKRTIKEFNALMKDIRIPNYSMAFTFCIADDKVSSVSKEIKNAVDNSLDDQVGVFNGDSTTNMVTIDYPEVNFNTQAVDSLTNRLTQMATMRFGAPLTSMFETQEFVIFKNQMESKLQTLLAGSKSVKNEKLSVTVWLDEYTKEGNGKQSAVSDNFFLNLQISLYQL